MSNAMETLNPPPDFTQRDFIVFGPVKAPAWRATCSIRAMAFSRPCFNPRPTFRPGATKPHCTPMEARHGKISLTDHTGLFTFRQVTPLGGTARPPSKE